MAVAPLATAASPLVDTTTADFSAGTLDANGYLGDAAGGEVLLAPSVGAEFAGAALPPGWSAFKWPEGTADDDNRATVGSGLLTVDGGRAGTDATFGPGRSLEFVATFGAGTFQHMGFGETYEGAPWAMFSTFNTTDTLYARTNAATGENTAIGPLDGLAHRFRIEWDATEVRYFVDGAPVATHAIVVNAPMRPLASDFTNGGAELTVDWVHLSPFASPSTFTSRVLDAGGDVDWGALDADVVTPAGTSVAFTVRTGPTPVPDGSWSAFTAIAPGGDIAGSKRYLQYRAQLATADSGATPVLESVSAAYAALTLVGRCGGYDVYTTSMGELSAPGWTGTIVAGTAAGEPLTGTPGRDLILGLGGADTINALGDDDVACGGEGADQVNGGDGNDRLYGEAGADVINAGLGNDQVFGGTEGDVIFAGTGNDQVLSEAGDDTVHAEAGNDQVLAGTGNDTVDAGSGNDQMLGEVGNDRMTGGTGADQFLGGSGIDRATDFRRTDPDQAVGVELFGP